MNREINTLSIKGLLDKRFWVIIVFFMLTHYCPKKFSQT